MPAVNKNRPKPWRASVYHRNYRYPLGYFDTCDEAELVEVDFKISLLEDRRRVLLARSNLLRTDGQRE